MSAVSLSFAFLGARGFYHASISGCDTVRVVPPSLRRLAREAVIFTLAGLVLTGVGSFAYLHHENWKKAAFDWSAYPVAKPLQKAPHPVWIYVDITEEFGGWFTTRPVVPDAIQNNHACVPGSIAYGPDNVQWVCVQPVPRITFDQPVVSKSDPYAPYGGVTLPAPVPVPISNLSLAITALFYSLYGVFGGFILWMFYRIV